MRKLIVIFLFPIIGFAQNDKNLCRTLFHINKLIEENHYKPKLVDDSLSVYVYNTFLEELDNNNSLFLISDCNEFKKYKLKIDDYIKEQNCDFLESFYNSYTIAVLRYQLMIDKIIKEPISYSSNEVIQFSNKRFPYYNSESGLKKLYKKKILFDILTTVSQTSENKDSIVSVFKQIADSTKIKILENYSCEAKNKTISKEKFYSIFINAFCSYFDPHTNYFSSSEKSDFLSGLSSSNYSFGMNMMQNKKNELSITEITPYGAAYYCHKLEVGDIVQKIKINGIEYSLNCNNNSKTYEVLNSNETKKATFIIKKNSGEIYSIELQKQLVRDYDNSVYSYILEFENKISGYIKIPIFYSKFENGKTNVSDDVKKEILMLINCKIESLIIDLQDNTGGSMQEAIQLCNFFINAPVVGLAKYSKNKQVLIGRENSKPIFSKPIVILINGYSASASEFFTNAMQDYAMAIVVGTKSLGKASIQEIFEIDNGSKDFLKITTGTFYRVTGKSNQYVGITPTITIPSIFDDQIPREKTLKKTLKNETIKGFIESNSYPFNENQSKIIQQYSAQFDTNPTIQKIIKLKKQVNKLFGTNISSITLNFNSVFNFLKTYNLLWKEINEFKKTEYGVQILNPIYSNGNNENLSNSDKIGIKDIKTNFTIIEAFKILNQLK